MRGARLRHERSTTKTPPSPHHDLHHLDELCLSVCLSLSLSLSDRLLWGGIGTLMQVNIEECMTKHTAEIRRMDAILAANRT